MFEKNIDNQTIALAGIYQSCLTVSNIAWKGLYKEEDFKCLINSIQKIDSNNIIDIYIDIRHLKPGLLHLKEQLVGDIFTRSSETRRYFSSLTELSRKLVDDSSMSSQIQALINNMNNQNQLEKLSIDDISSKLSDIYINTLSKFEPRIVVSGENKYLTNPAHASRIRTALFSGLRSMILWRQAGGSKLKLFFLKSRIANKIEEYLNIN